MKKDRNQSHFVVNNFSSAVLVLEIIFDVFDHRKNIFIN